MHFTLVVSLPACREELLSKLKAIKPFVLLRECCVSLLSCLFHKKRWLNQFAHLVWNHWNDDKRGYGCGARLEMKPALF